MARRATIAESRAVAVKLAGVIALCAALGVGLLSARQRRLAAAHDLAEHHALIVERQRAVLTLKQEIMQRVALPRLRAAAADAGLATPVLAPAPPIEPAGPLSARSRDALGAGMVIE